MPIDTSVPAITFGPTGFVAPTEAAILTGVLADQNAAFGGDMNPALETPQGQLASSTTAIIGDTNDAFLALANGVDPAYASGRLQDAIARIYFLTRTPAEPTTTEALCTGLSGTVIPVGARAIDTDGTIWLATETVTIPIGGSVTVPFACSVTGPVPLPANSLNRIYQAIPGWDTINNATDGVLGNDVESRATFEARRAASVALNAVGVLPAIRASVLAVADVLDAYVTENDTAAPVVVGGVTLAAHSLYVCVAGGAPLDVATAIWRKKNPGCAYNGDTTVVVEDDQSGYAPPYPSYDVTFQTAAALPIIFTVTLADNQLVPADVQTLVRAAIVAAFAGVDGGPRAQIGATVFASRFYAAVASLGSWAQIRSIFVGSPTTAAASVTGSIAASVLTVSAVASGALAVGQTILGDTVAAGTIILAQLTGTPWGVGTYTVTLNQTVTSRALDAVLPAATSVAVDIDQIPTVAAGNIAVSVT